MIKTLLVPLLGLDTDKVAIQTGHQLARITGAHIDCLHVRPDPAANAMQMTGYAAGLTLMTPDLSKFFEENARHSAETARRTFEDFCKEMNCTVSNRPVVSEQVSASFHEVEGDLVKVVVAAAKVHELAILSRNFGYSGFNEYTLGDVLMGCGRPIILAANKPLPTSGQHIAVAWKPTADAARAITAVMPLLTKAGKISLLSAEEVGQTAEETAASLADLAKELSWHGLTAEAHCLLRSSDTPASVINEAHRLEADLLVMGAYGHSRARELFFGGFTRHVLRAAPMPVFLVH